MPSIEELLEQAENETSAIEPVNDILEIDPETRTVLIPDSEIIFGVEADQRAERKYFRCPKIVGNNIDLSELEIYVIFQNAGGSEEENRDAYHVLDLEDTGDGYVTFSWELTEKVTRYVGQVSFVVAATRTLSDGTLQNRWSTTIATGKSLIGLQTGMSENEQQQASDLYTQLITELNAKAEIKKSEITTLTNEKKSLLENTGTNQKNLVESEGTKQIQAVENKGTATLATIPEDYTALNTSVNDLSDIMHMKAPAIVEEATSGTEITVNDSADGMRLQELNVYGKSWQFTTTGSNLFKVTKTSETLKGITFDVKKDGTIKVSGTNTESSALYVILGTFEVVAGQTYIFNNFYSLESSDIETYVQIKNDIVLGKINAREKDRYMYTAKEAGMLNVSFKVKSGVTIDTTLSKMQINVGETVLSYEPYTGGKSSPSPDYPQEIESVGRVLSTGKNLFDFSKLDANYGLNAKDKTIVIPAKTNNIGYYNSLKELCPNIKAGDTYVLSAKTSNPEALRIIHLVNVNVDLKFGKAFIPTEEQINDKISFYNYPDTEKENVISEIQLEKGNIATSYEPYTGGVPALYQKDVEVKLTGKNLSSIKSAQLSTNVIKSDIVQWTKKDRIYFSCDTENVENLKMFVMIRYCDENRESLGANGALLPMDGTRKETSFSGAGGGSNGTNIDLTTVEYVNVEVSLRISSALTPFVDNIMLCDEANQPYKPYKQPQSLPIITPTGLPAIPVPSSTSGITYTDADGQAWIADEIDFRRSKYIQRVWNGVFDGSEDEAWSAYTSTISDTFIRKGFIAHIPSIQETTWDGKRGLSNQGKLDSPRNDNTVGIDGIWLGRSGAKIIDIPYSSYYDDSIEDYGLSNWKAHLAEHPLKVMTYLDNPIETDLSEEQIQAYKAIHTNKPTTIISNDADAWMGASYAADTKIWIENKIKEIVTS